MKRLFKNYFWLFLLLLLAGHSAMAAATGGDVLMDYLVRSAIFAPNELSIALTQEFRYNDNIDESHYRSKNIDSFINDTMLTMKWTRTISQITYGLEAKGEYEHYFRKRKNDDSSDFSYTLSPVLIGEIGDDFLGIFGGKLMGSFHSSYEREEVDASENKTTSVFRNNLNLAWSVPVTGKVFLIWTGKVNSERYRDKLFKPLDNEKYGLSLSPTYRYSQRTRLGLTAGITKTDYRENTEHDDYDDVKFGLFMEHLLSERSAFWVEGGVTRLYYDKGTVSEASHAADDWEWYFRSRLVYQLLKDLSLGLTYSHDVEDSFSSGARGKRLMDEFAGTLTWNLTGKVKMFQKLAFSRRNEVVNDEDNDRIELDLHLQYESSHGMTTYVGWNMVKKNYKFEKMKNYLENEWRVGLKFTF